MQKLLKQLDLGGMKKQLDICRTWPDVVGKLISSHTYADRFGGGTLYVIVDSPSWHTELTYIKPDILKRFEEKIGRRLVQDIHLRVGRIIREVPLPQEPPAPPPVIPPTVEQIADADQRSSHIEDDELRAAIKRAFIAASKSKP